MHTITCSVCGKSYDHDGGAAQCGGFVAGSQWDAADCSHCQFCMYEDCAVYLESRKWVCTQCARRNLAR